MTLAAVTLAAPTPFEEGVPSDIEVRNSVRIAEVLERMEQDLGELDWDPTPDGGKVLSVSSPRWHEYTDIILAEKNRTSTLQARDSNLQKRARVPELYFPTNWAEYGCYSQGSYGVAQASEVYPDATSACNNMNLNPPGNYVKVYVGPQRKNNKGEPMTWNFKFEKFGTNVISPPWTFAQCQDAFMKVAPLCLEPFDGITRGGWIDIYSGSPYGTSRGSHGYSYTVDPTTLNCNC